MSAPGRRLMLERRVTGSNTGGVADVLLLHDGEGRPEQLVDFAAALSARRCIIPRAPRWASLRGEGLYSWFTSPAYGVVDPVGLGDSLSQLEMLLLSAGDESPNGKLGAVGFGQGAVMAATLAAFCVGGIGRRFLACAP
jgi:predicted esterase